MAIATRIIRSAGRKLVTRLLDRVGSKVVSRFADTSADAPNAFHKPKRDVYGRAGPSGAPEGEREGDAD